MDGFKDFLAFIGIILVLLLTLGGGIAAILVPISWHQSCRQAEIYNRLNGTGWTCSDFFWAGDQINSSSSTVQLKGVAP